jgi:hypothetical protein
MYNLKANDDLLSVRSSRKETGILHKFRSHQVNPKTKMLLAGTFHPDISKSGDFFYSLAGNCLWKILPACYDEGDLRESPLRSKRDFMDRHRIDFMDIIGSLKQGFEGERYHYGDEFIDSYIDEWNDLEQAIDRLDFLESVYFTRKTFGRIPNIERRVAEIRNHCVEKSIRFSLLETPARYFNDSKIQSWKLTLIEKTICR